jgi:hypothetical protein
LVEASQPVLNRRGLLGCEYQVMGITGVGGSTWVMASKATNLMTEFHHGTTRFESICCLEISPYNFAYSGEWFSTGADG